MPKGDLSPELYLNYIQAHVPEVGEPNSPGFFRNLLEQYDPNREWPTSPTEQQGSRRFMSEGWMYNAGIVIARGQDKIDDFIEVLRETDSPEEQALALLDIVDEDERPDLLEEAAMIWDRYVFEKQHHADEDFDIGSVYEYICVLAARFEKPELFEANLSRVPSEDHPAVLSQAAKFDEDRYLERAITGLESLEHDSDTDYDVSINMMEIALDHKNYATAIRALTMCEGIFCEPQFFDDVVNKALAEDEIEKLREAVQEHAQGRHRYQLAIRMAKGGDEDSVYLAGESLRGIARDGGEDGDEALYGFPKAVLEASENFDNEEMQTKIKKMMRSYIQEAFWDAYKSEDLNSALNAAIGLLQIDRSLELMRVIAFDKSGEVEELAEDIRKKTYYDIPYGTTGLINCMIEAGKEHIIRPFIVLTDRQFGPFSVATINMEADKMLEDEIISQSDYQTLMSFIASASQQE